MNEKTHSHSSDKDNTSKRCVNTPSKTKNTKRKNKGLSVKMKKALKQIHKQERQSVLDRICEALESVSGCNINQVLDECKAEHPWMTRSIFNRAQVKYREKLEQQVKEAAQHEQGYRNLCSMPVDTFGNESLSTDYNNPNVSTPVNSQKREGRKKRKKGEPRRKFATLYHMPEGAEHAVDITRVCHSESVLKKLKQSEKKFLADAYQQMNDAKQEYDREKALFDQYQSQHERQLQIVASMDEKKKGQLQIVKGKEELIQKASDYVTEQELKSDCPWNANY